MNPIALFQDELFFINNRNIRLFVESCLLKAPKYIYTDAPSSSSGKYHPSDELGGNGCVIHTKRVVWVTKQLGGDDLAIAAAIIHDLVKQGWKKSGHTVREHPGLAAQLVGKVHRHNRNLIRKNEMVAIRSAVGFHYGQWGVGAYRIPSALLCTRRDLLVHMADMIASRKGIGENIAVSRHPSE